MDKTTIKDSIRYQPFKKFILKMSDGQVFVIDDPGRLAVSPDQEIAVIFTEGHYHVVDIEKITSLEILP